MVGVTNFTSGCLWVTLLFCITCHTRAQVPPSDTEYQSSRIQDILYKSTFGALTSWWSGGSQATTDPPPPDEPEIMDEDGEPIPDEEEHNTPVENVVNEPGTESSVIPQQVVEAFASEPPAQEEPKSAKPKKTDSKKKMEEMQTRMDKMSDSDETKLKANEVKRKTLAYKIKQISQKMKTNKDDPELKKQTLEYKQEAQKLYRENQQLRKKLPQDSPQNSPLVTTEKDLLPWLDTTEKPGDPEPVDFETFFATRSSLDSIKVVTTPATEETSCSWESPLNDCDKQPPETEIDAEKDSIRDELRKLEKSHTKVVDIGERDEPDFDDDDDDEQLKHPKKKPNKKKRSRLGALTNQQAATTTMIPTTLKPTTTIKPPTVKPTTMKPRVRRTRAPKQPEVVTEMSTTKRPSRKTRRPRNIRGGPRRRKPRARPTAEPRRPIPAGTKP